jgi:hypothetical protein
MAVIGFSIVAEADVLTASIFSTSIFDSQPTLVRVIMSAMTPMRWKPDCEFVVGLGIMAEALSLSSDRGSAGKVRNFRAYSY